MASSGSHGYPHQVLIMSLLEFVAMEAEETQNQGARIEK